MASRSSRTVSPAAVPAARRRRQPTEIRRLMIVDAARQTIAERGLGASTVRDIAEAAGVSLGTLTYHFTGIAEILNEVLEREMAVYYEPLIDKARDTEGGLEALQTLVDLFFANDERSVQHWRLWLDFWSVSARDEQYARWQERIYLRWRADVLQLFTRASEQGDVRVDDLGTAVSDFLALFDGLAVQAYLPRAPFGPEDARRHLTGWLDRAAAERSRS